MIRSGAGQEMTVKIESIDTEQKRMALAPEDYVAKEEASEERYTPPPVAKESASMGTLGDLLKSQLKKKKNKWGVGVQCDGEDVFYVALTVSPHSCPRTCLP